MTASVPNPSGAAGVVAIAEEEATALFARGGFSTARRERINRYIRRWKLAGCWSKIASLWFFAAETRDQALLNWVVSAGADATFSGSPDPVFTADKGFSGFAVNRSVSCPWNPAALGGSDIGIAFAGLTDSSLPQNSDPGADLRILTSFVAGSEVNGSLLNAGPNPRRSHGLVSSRSTDRLCVAVRNNYTIAGETAYGTGMGSASSFGVGTIRTSTTTLRPGILKRWSGLAVLNATMTEAETFAFARIWEDLVGETNALA